MDFDSLLQSVVRFSNFMTSRLVVSGLFFYVLSGFIDVGSASEGFLPNLDLFNNVVENYQNIFSILGVSEFALLLIFFLFLTAIHLTYHAFERVGAYIPPAIVPLSGWQAIEDLTKPTFKVLREARGEEHTDQENQRLYEFSRKLELIDAANEQRYKVELEVANALYNVAKTFVVFALLAYMYAILFGSYTGDPSFLLVILALAVATALITALTIFRGNYERIEELRAQVANQLMSFAVIWTLPQYQAEVTEACENARTLRPASFQILVPIYGTLGAFVDDIRWLRGQRQAPNDRATT